MQTGNMPSISDRISAVKQQIANSALQCGRDPEEITLIGVSKRQPPSAIVAARAAGLQHFAENYLDEATGKQAKIPPPAPQWHFIGPVQSNKTRGIAAQFDWVQSVDREKIARRLNQHRPETHSPLNICIQVNISGENSKSGVSVDAVPTLARAVSECPRLRLRGLMGIAAQSPDPSVIADQFARLRETLDRLNDTGFDLDTLSMGMSGDLDIAVRSGSTMLRVGTALFGPRTD